MQMKCLFHTLLLLIIQLSVSSHQHSHSGVNGWSRKVGKDYLLVLGNNVFLPKNVEYKQILLSDELVL